MKGTYPRAFLDNRLEDNSKYCMYDNIIPLQEYNYHILVSRTMNINIHVHYNVGASYYTRKTHHNNVIVASCMYTGAH